MNRRERVGLVVGVGTIVIGLVAVTAQVILHRAELRRAQDERMVTTARALERPATALLGAPQQQAWETVKGWQLASSLRLTLIAADGRVLADSASLPDQLKELDNHGNRPEVVAAMHDGEGLSRRRSATTNRLTTYVARRLGGSSPLGVLRAAWEEEPVGFPWGGVGSALLVAVAAGMLAWRGAWRLQRDAISHLVRWADLPASEDLDAIAADAGRHFDEQRSSLLGDRESLRLALAQVSEGVVLLDRQRRIRLLNAAAIDLLSADLKEGHSILEGIRTPELLAAVEEAMRAGKQVHTSLIGRDATELAVQVSPLADSALAAAVVLRDVTGERRLERARRALVADMAHELRTPLTVLNGVAEEMRLEGRDAGVAETIERQVGRLAAFSQELEELARIESGQLRLEVSEVDATSLARGVLQDLQGQAEAARVRLSLDGPSVTLRTDPVRLAQVLTNLVDNAIRYNRPDGSVRVTVEAVEGGARVAVIDTGLGIPSADVPLVFQRFYRVRRASGPEEGSGLGLAIVKHLVSALGGTVQLASRQGEGTEVTVTLPGQLPMGQQPAAPDPQS